MTDDLHKNPSFYRCTCSCGCENIVEPPKFDVFLSLVKCSLCLTPTHAKNHNSLHSNKKFTETSTKTTGRVQPKYEISEEEKSIAMKAHKEVERELWLQAWNVWCSRLPQKFREANTESFPTSPLVVKKIQQITQNKAPISAGGLLIRGKVGRGKTWLAVGYANDLIKKGVLHPSEVLFGSESSLLSSAANATFKDVEKELRTLTAGKYKMIIIDDIGRGTWLRDDMRPKIFSLVFDKQWSDGNTVVATTNLAREELARYIGSAAMDRLLSMCGYAPDIVMEGVDQRREQTNEMIRNARNKS